MNNPSPILILNCYWHESPNLRLGFKWGLVTAEIASVIWLVIGVMVNTGGN